MAIFYVQERLDSGQPVTVVGSDQTFGGVTYDVLLNQGVYRTNRRPVFVNFRGDRV